MVVPKASGTNNEHTQLVRIKRLAIAAMFSDDELMEDLVLKGGNAMALVHGMAARESIDLDFSMSGDFPDKPERIRRRVERSLQRTFRSEGFEPIDVRLALRPAALSEDLACFWGGYAIEFKLVASTEYQSSGHDTDKLRRSAVSIGQGKKFLIDISRFEFVDDKEKADFDGYIIYVYSPLMIACEKLRAICQQMDEYGPVVRRSRPAAQRARDFFDIHSLVEQQRLDLLSPRAIDTVCEMFRVKRVKLAWLERMDDYREMHRAGWPAVQATVASHIGLRDFDFYFDYVSELALKIMTSAGFPRSGAAE